MEYQGLSNYYYFADQYKKTNTLFALFSIIFDQILNGGNIQRKKQCPDGSKADTQ